MMNPMVWMLKTFMFDRPSRNKSFAALGQSLTEGRDAIMTRIEASDGNEKSHKQLTHLIGVERWAQNRVKVALGEAFIDEEYDRYRPARDAAWLTLKDEFWTTRNASIALTKALDAAKVDRNTLVAHNQFGEIPVRAWLQYIYGHSDFESKNIK